MLVRDLLRRAARLSLPCILAGAASAAAPTPVVVKSTRDLYSAIDGARVAAIADCRTKPHTVLFQQPGDAQRFVEYTWAFRNVKAVCTDSRRDGAVSFELTETTRNLVGKKLESATQTTANWEGELVAGVAAGLWCRGPELRKTTKPNSTKFEPSPLPIAGVAHCVLKGTPQEYVEGRRRFAKRADGRWVYFEWAETPGLIEELVPVGVLEARSRALIDAVRAGEKPPAAAPFTVEIPQLADLVAGGTVLYAPEKAPRDLKKRTVGLAFTTRAGDELRGWTRTRAALIDATSNVKAQDARGYQRFLVASEPRRLLEAMAQGFRPHAARLRPLVDLAPLAAGEVDYAFVVDWKIEPRADVLGKYDALRKASPKIGTPDLVTTRVGYLLIDRDFNVVAKWNTNQGVAPYRFNAGDYTHQVGSGDREYLYQLTQQLTRQWGVVEPLQSAFDQAHYSLVGFDGSPK